MLNIESKLWKVKTLPGGLGYITQKASNTTRYIHASRLPSDKTLGNISEKQFNRLMSDLFHRIAS